MEGLKTQIFELVDLIENEDALEFVYNAAIVGLRWGLKTDKDSEQALDSFALDE